MTVEVWKLRATLRELETELRAVTELDAESKAMLELALEEIDAALHAKSPAASHPQSLGERLRLSAGDFEGSHPALAGIMHRVVDALSQLGI
jgi:hypothetical protein